MREIDTMFPCQWRGDTVKENRFACSLPIQNTPKEVSSANCALCGYRSDLSLGTIRKQRKQRGKCRYLGHKTNELKDSIYCGSLKNVPLYECALLGRCTPEVKLAGYRDKDGSYVEVPWCPSCEKHEEVKEETTLFPLIQIDN